MSPKLRATTWVVQDSRNVKSGLPWHESSVTSILPKLETSPISWKRPLFLQGDLFAIAVGILIDCCFPKRPVIDPPDQRTLFVRHSDGCSQMIGVDKKEF